MESARNTNDNLRPPPNEQQDGESSGNDSLLELYNQSSGRSRTSSRDRNKVKRKASRGAVTTLEETPEDDESKWIHRDKLAQIESRELAEMGVRYSRPSRASSRKSVKTNKSSVDANETGQEEQQFEEFPLRDGKRQRQLPPTSSGQDEYSLEDMPDRYGSQGSQDLTPASRPGTSRIPVPATTPLTGSAAHEHGESPLSPQGTRRKRSVSGSAYPKTRSRSQSGGSQHLLNMTNNQDALTSASEDTQTSPATAGQRAQKSRIPSKETPQSRSRAGSAAKKGSGPRQASGTNGANKESPKRPGTSGGARPPTARPEGEAPWIATMYKPDPRLPPDQQMLPTHAKRIAQMQQDPGNVRREQESEFTLLPDSDEPNSGNDQSQDEELVKEASPQRARKRDSGQGSLRNSWQKQHRQNQLADRRESSQWPLRSPSGHSVHPEQLQKRERMSQQFQERTSLQLQQNNLKTDPEIWISGKNSVISPDHGGYGLMPNTQPQQQEQKRDQRASRQSRISEKEKQLEESAAYAPVNQPVRLQEEKEEDGEKKKKGCGGCCVVM